MRALLSGVPGVVKASISIPLNPKDRLNSPVSMKFDPEKTSRPAIAKKVREVWDIAWYECPCGKTAITPAECCGQKMKPAP
jgi:hypothetical protein